ncbi:unnamed protein product [Mytilus coruscus]|uniref:Uncharacterized protein n=1 Tax=Mytilus coruscus TaxID=42192 RepID=A0A6J8CAS3_MYTCO|nr:unnamed protein product [Mytilus coruscus]
MVVNELPPTIRFRRENRILCGLWFGKEKPNFPTFFKPFTELLWKLYTDGFVVKDENGDDQKCKAMLLKMTCDSPAKCLFQNFIQYNGYYGCPYCLLSGTYDKTVLLGVMKRLLNFWFGKDKNEIFSISNRRSEVEQGLMEIKPPNNITRSPRTLDELKHWKEKYVQRGISVVGKAEEANLADHENVFPLVKLAKPSFTGITLKYKRALLQGEMIHSKIYQKVSQRNSFTVEYQNLTDKEYGEILFFLGLDDDYLAVVNKFTKKKCALTEDHTTGPSGGHLLTLEKQREQDIVLVSLSDIHGKVIYMDVHALEFTVVGMFPNRTEKDLKL